MRGSPKAGLALGVALSLLGAAGIAEAAPARGDGRAVTVQANSNLRDSNVWMWGGNVNVGADPAPGIPVC
ncbi:hypothetical protein [Streptomyces apricus]|uniref:Uncharacterized protein n=1 Tax=Streptomyces apricus TaxID=1828112 RepID=A0A5B0BJQ4_9ACTN|nr:hypothetical protein [Streptomyces apricus]KAA0940905.1 hypothetical protein FGF04_08625 [Streptomyces apricus]